MNDNVELISIVYTLLIYVSTVIEYRKLRT